MTISVVGDTNVGKKRTNNEDSYYIAKLEQGAIFLVADGVGGNSYGEVASATAVEVIDGLVKSGKLNALSQITMTTMMLTMAVQKAHVTIANKAQDNAEYDGMSSTLTLAYVNGNKLWVAQVGDSRLYRHSDSGLAQLTKDQTIAEALLNAGRISKSQALVHPDRNTLSQSLGLEAVGKPLETVVTEHDWLAGDSLIACSDGLTDMVSDADIEAIMLRDDALEQKLRMLINAALDGGGKDNITVVLAVNSG